jgi:large subunit ribosomal protein L23
LGEVKNPHEIIIKPHITEKSVANSYGDPRIRDEADLVRKYTFLVAPDANKIEIKQAIESIYNTGKKADQAVTVTNVHTVNLPRKQKRRGRSAMGFTTARRKAVVTLAKGQMLEDYGV